MLSDAIIATISMCCMMENHNSTMIFLMQVCTWFIRCEIYLDVSNIKFMWLSLLCNNLLIFFLQVGDFDFELQHLIHLMNFEVIIVLKPFIAFASS
jgi:hypothetical protein